MAYLNFIRLSIYLDLEYYSGIQMVFYFVIFFCYVVLCNLQFCEYCSHCFIEEPHCNTTRNVAIITSSSIIVDHRRSSSQSSSSLSSLLAAAATLTENFINMYLLLVSLHWICLFLFFTILYKSGPYPCPFLPIFSIKDTCN